jgi:transposase-like protein
MRNGRRNREGSSSDWSTARRWTREQARAALAALASSGEPVTRFAARHGLGAHRVYEWRRRLGAEVVSAATFVELARPTEVSTVADRFEVILRSGDQLRIPATFDAVALGRLIAILRRSASC